MAKKKLPKSKQEWMAWLVSQRRAWSALLGTVLTPLALSLGYVKVAGVTAALAGLLAVRSLAKPKK